MSFHYEDEYLPVNQSNRRNATTSNGRISNAIKSKGSVKDNNKTKRRSNEKKLGNGYCPAFMLKLAGREPHFLPHLRKAAYGEIEIFFGMSCRNLCADPRFSFRYNRVGKPYHVHTFCKHA